MTSLLMLIGAWQGGDIHTMVVWGFVGLAIDVFFGVIKGLAEAMR